jgi:hypothetical protein
VRPAPAAASPAAGFLTDAVVVYRGPLRVDTILRR